MNKSTLLILDDNVAERELAHEAMAVFGQGFELTTAGTPDDAARHVAAHSPSVVLIDLHLGRWNGRELIPHLRGQCGTYILTTTENPLERQLCLAAGANGFWLKPATFDDYAKLFERIRAALIHPQREQ